ncbi:MAG TPA: addiction module toxin, HicA family [Treponema sp.]|nr:addiction module toxin, HicA family [Treponema sp.]
MKNLSSREILRLLLADGWSIKHQVESHVQLVHPTKSGKVMIPHPKKDLAPGTALSIAR